MIAVRIGPDWRLIAVASPDYLAQHCTPRSPQELVDQNCINHRQSRSGGLYAWEFAKDGRELRVRVDGQLTFNTSIAMVDAALNGLGIAYIPRTWSRTKSRLDSWCRCWTTGHPCSPGTTSTTRAGGRTRLQSLSSSTPCEGMGGFNRGPRSDPVRSQSTSGAVRPPAALDSEWYGRTQNAPMVLF